MARAAPLAHGCEREAGDDARAPLRLVGGRNPARDLAGEADGDRATLAVVSETERDAPWRLAPIEITRRAACEAVRECREGFSRGAPGNRRLPRGPMMPPPPAGARPNKQHRLGRARSPCLVPMTMEVIPAGSLPVKLPSAQARTATSQSGPGTAPSTTRARSHCGRWERSRGGERSRRPGLPSSMGQPAGAKHRPGSSARCRHTS
jgi:hypothetical protein